jgi:hypothetical protein
MSLSKSSITTKSRSTTISIATTSTLLGTVVQYHVLSSEETEVERTSQSGASRWRLGSATKVSPRPLVEPVPNILELTFENILGALESTR